MATAPDAHSRSYQLVPYRIRPDLAFAGTGCDRPIWTGYPFVAVVRDATRPDAVLEEVGGRHKADVLSVYRDPLAALWAPGAEPLGCNHLKTKQKGQQCR